MTLPVTHLAAHTQRLDIQGLRAIAVVLVVAFHAGLPVPGGFVGVDVFFVISGFVITGMLHRELASRGTLDLSRFYGRRVKRLVPALVVVIVVVVALSFLLGSPFDDQQQTTALTAAGAITMTANAVVFLTSGGYFDAPLESNPLLNTWSLSVEEQIYLVFPAFLMLLWWLGRRIKSGNHQLKVVGGGILVVGTLSFLLCVTMTFGIWSFHLSDPEWFAFYSSPTRLWEFAVGALIALLLSGRGVRISAILGTLLLAVSLVGILLSGFVITEASMFPGYVALLPVMATALAIVAGTISEPRGSWILGNRAFVRVGDLSYSWYLWHWPLIAFALILFPELDSGPVLAALLSLGLAALTLRIVENPMRFSTWIKGPRIAGFAFASVALVLAVSAALYWGSSNAWWNPSIERMSAQVSTQPLWRTSDCNTPLAVNERGPNCTFNADGLGSPIYLLGDSQAGQLSNGLRAAANALGRPLVLGTKGACPSIDAVVVTDGRIDVECSEMVQANLVWLEQQPPATIVMSSWLSYISLDSVSLSLSSGKPVVTDVAGKQEIYVYGLARAVHRLSVAGHDVHVVEQIPGFPTTLTTEALWYPSQCSTISVMFESDSCGVQRSEQEVIAETASIDAQIDLAVHESGGDLINLRKQLCHGSVCSTNFSDVWAYLDGAHISVNQSNALAGTLIEAVR